MDVLVARQAIFDRDRRVHGYELLFRSSAEHNAFDGTDGTLATKQVLANSLLVIGMDNLVGRKKAFVNFGRGPLLQGWHASLPKGTTVIELLENVEPDAEVLEACRKLRQQGYRLALDDFVFRPEYEALLDVADLIKIEVNGATRAEQQKLVRYCQSRGMDMLAEKVETPEEFEWARQAGYNYFQGYFFARPAVMRARQIPAQKLHCLRLLQEAQRPELDFDRLEKLILADVSLSYQLLRYVNSALFGLRNQIRSIPQALMFFGENELRKWIALATLTRAADDKPGELILHSLVRARFCEAVARLLHLGLEESAFLMGLFSLLDALVDRPLEDTLAEVNVAPEITAVLTGKAPAATPLARIYALARTYEVGDWDQVETLACGLGARAEQLGDAYCQALHWAGEVLEQGTSQRP
ncbi:MAG TPA: HDOD domain-containing protein [Bryobacteraceae bacterium]|nr:HDOD domain-containing protein [Bryobacteraceae bacterium]